MYENDLRRVFAGKRVSDVLGRFRVDGRKSRISTLADAVGEVYIHLSNGTKMRMNKTDLPDIYEIFVDDSLLEENYRISFKDESGNLISHIDPYSFRSTLSDFDIYLFKEGDLIRSYYSLGAHLETRRDVPGVVFRVWAPNAITVSVIGDFNRWRAGITVMDNVQSSGIWEIFVPELHTGELYKFAVQSSIDGRIRIKTDPFAFQVEKRPKNACIVSDLSYEWGDGNWIMKRGLEKLEKDPLSVYEVHAGSWMRGDDPNSFMNFRELADRIVPYVSDLGFTHIELMPIMEHPLDLSWGYQIINYYAPTSRYGTPSDFMYFVNKCHINNIGVILDWVPAHFPGDQEGLAEFDGTHLYEHADPRLGLHPDWGTRIFNYGRFEVRNFLLSNAIFWLEKYHVDGIRIDAVSSMLYLDYSRKEGEWIPNKYGGRENLEAIDFLRSLNSKVHEYYSGVITVAEESTAWPKVTSPTETGGLGFDFKWNMGWMHDTLEYFSMDPIYRKYHQDRLTFTLWYAFSEKFILPYSHDEVVHLKGSMYNKMPGDEWQKFANLRAAYSFMFSSPGKKLLFMGDEFAVTREWKESEGLQWDLLDRDMNSKIRGLVRDLNAIYKKHDELHRLDSDYRGFRWIDFNDSAQSVLSFMRFSDLDDEPMICVFNLTPVVRRNYSIGVPKKGVYDEIFNSDSTLYGGSGVGNLGKVNSVQTRMHGFENSIEITLPPLAAVFFKREKDHGEQNNN
ncbi:MAG: 1,4-alpha-glucan branching protein GlgB [Thermoplasmata archaeon]